MIHLADLLAADPLVEVDTVESEARWSRFCFDSRLAEPGDLFVAVRTGRGDGHQYIADAVARGANAALVADASTVPPGCMVLRCADPVATMERYGAWAVRTWKPTVVAITGTVGKTSTKELVADVLSTRYAVFRNPGNFSGRFGLAVALGGLRPEHQIAVLEMATGHFGEIDAMCDMAPPDVGVVTSIDAAHLVALGTVEGVAQEKGRLLERLSADGVAVLVADDPRVADLARRSVAPVTTVGRFNGAEFRAVDVAVSGTGTQIEVESDGWRGHLTVPWLGDHVADAALVALAVGRHFGVDTAAVESALRDTAPLPGRLRSLVGHAGSLLLDDTYNAAPRSVLAGLDTLAAVVGATAGRAVVVLGDMAELGESSESWHRTVGERAADVADVLVTQGRAAAWAADAALDAGMDPERVAVTFTAEDAAAAVRPSLGPDVTVLVKGSASARMERVTALLLDEGIDPSEVLVRQDSAWRSTGIVSTERPTWLEIDLGAVAHNVRSLVGRASGADVMVVLKADAYGHGAVQVAHTALRHGATRLGVACVPEAAALRRAGVRAPILVLGFTPGWQAREAVRLDLSVAVFDLGTAQAFAQAARDLDRQADVQVKVDTGMHRLGVSHDDAASFVRAVAALEGITVSGVFTHLARADERSPEGVAATDEQLTRFRQVIAELEASGDRPPVVHVANSAGLLARDDCTFDMVRPGIAVYGLSPGPEVPVDDLIPVLRWCSQIAQVHDLGPGEPVGYGGTWRTRRPSRIATVPVGYADGLRRAPATWHHVLVRGRPAPLVGRVSMDQISIDVSDIAEVRSGDQVTLIGSQGSAAITPDVVAEWLGTSAYEVVSGILARVPRLS